MHIDWQWAIRQRNGEIFNDIGVNETAKIKRKKGKGKGKEEKRKEREERELDRSVEKNEIGRISIR